MARATKSTKTQNAAPEKRKSGRPAGSVAKTARLAATDPKRTARTAETSERRKPGRPPKTATAAALPKGKTATKVPARMSAASPAPKVSKDELRAQVERLEQLVASLRTKGREANKAAKAATARISELEAQVARQEQKAPSSTARQPAQQARVEKPARGKRKGREIDPGDAVPPGVAVQEPEPLDEEAETALENLNEHLGRD